MACSRNVKEAARRYWLLGYSDEKILPLLKRDFPSEKTPSRAKTILEWRQKETWAADLEIIAAKADQKRTENLADELAKMSEKQLGLLTQLDAHLQLLLTRIVRDQSGKAIDTQLTPSELSQMAQALDRTIKNKRLIRGVPTTQTAIDANVQLAGELDVTQFTTEELERIAKGDDLFTVLSPVRLRSLGLKR